jgi:hypothetical protein
MALRFTNTAREILTLEGSFASRIALTGADIKMYSAVGSPVLLHSQLQHGILPGSHFFLAAYGTLSRNIFKRHAHLYSVDEIKEYVF